MGIGSMLGLSLGNLGRREQSSDPFEPEGDKRDIREIDADVKRIAQMKAAGAEKRAKREFKRTANEIKSVLGRRDRTAKDAGKAKDLTLKQGNFYFANRDLFANFWPPANYDELKAHSEYWQTFTLELPTGLVTIDDKVELHAAHLVAGGDMPFDQFIEVRSCPESAVPFFGRGDKFDGELLLDFAHRHGMDLFSDHG